MIPTHTPQTCRWAQPARFVPLPGWTAVAGAPWMCVGEDASRSLLDARADCASCPRWRERAPEHADWILTQAAC